MNDIEFSEFLVYATKLFPGVGKMDQAELDLWHGWMKRYPLNAMRQAASECRKSSAYQRIQFSELEKECRKIIDRWKNESAAHEAQSRPKFETIVAWIRRMNGGDTDQPAKYGPDWTDWQVIVDHFSRCWTLVSETVLDEPARSLGRKSVLGYAKMALKQIGMTDRDADEAGREIVGLAPGEVIDVPKFEFADVPGPQIQSSYQAVKALAAAEKQENQPCV